MDRVSPIEVPSAEAPIIEAPIIEAPDVVASLPNEGVPVVATLGKPTQTKSARPTLNPVKGGQAEQKFGTERRQSPRMVVELDVSLHARTDFYGGFTENLSLGGTFIATHLLKPVGETLAFSLFLPQIDFTVRGTGEVRWHRSLSEVANSPPGMGIRFVTLEAGSAAAIEAFLRDHQEPPPPR